MDRIEIGKILTTVGLKGELKVMPETADINRFKKLKTFYIDNNEYECEYATIRNDKVCLKIKGFNKIEEVEKFRNKAIYVDRKDSIPLQKGEYLAVDLMGCEVWQGDKYIGLITEIYNFGASDVIFVKNKGVEHSFVYVDDLFEKVLLYDKKIYVTDKIEEVLCD